MATRRERAAREQVIRFRLAAARVLRVVDAFNALSADEQHLVAERLAEIMSAGLPQPATFTALEEEARCWAAFAAPRELRAYLAAAFAALPRHERKAALRALGRAA